MRAKYYETIIFGLCAYCSISLFFFCDTQDEIMETALFSIISVILVLIAAFINETES